MFRASSAALWALHGVGGLDEALLLSLFDSSHEDIRGWAVRLAVEDRKPAAAVLSQLNRLAAREPSPSVRLSLASALQRLPVTQRWTIAGRWPARRTTPRTPICRS